MRMLRIAAFGLAVLFVAATAPALAQPIVPDTAQNPRPSEALGAFDRFEISRIEMPEPFASKKGGQKALARIQTRLDEKLAGPMAEWNNRPSSHEPPRLLRIEPRIVRIKFVGGATRFFVGALAGKSAVLMRVRLTDAATGTIIGDPEFYSQAAALSGSYSLGAADNAMLTRVASVIVLYLTSNQDEAVGGPTSMPGKQKEVKSAN
jgi:hypothetical protein